MSSLREALRGSPGSPPAFHPPPRTLPSDLQSEDPSQTRAERNPVVCAKAARPSGRARRGAGASCSATRTPALCVRSASRPRIRAGREGGGVARATQYPGDSGSTPIACNQGRLPQIFRLADSHGSARSDPRTASALKIPPLVPVKLKCPCQRRTVVGSKMSLSVPSSTFEKHQLEISGELTFADPVETCCKELLP